MTGLDQDGNVLWSFNIRDHLGWPYLKGFTLLKDSVAAMDEGDTVWIVVRGPYFDDAGLAAVGNPSGLCLLCKLDESGLPSTAYENSAASPALTTPAFVALTHIRNLRAITVSTDGNTVVVIGTHVLTGNTWIETYDRLGTLISTYDATAIFGTAPRLHYTDADHLAVGQKIWTVNPPTGTADYATWRRWTGSNQRGRLQSDGRSVWGGNRDCPGKLATDTTGSL